MHKLPWQPDTGKLKATHMFEATHSCPNAMHTAANSVLSMQVGF